MDDRVKVALDYFRADPHMNGPVLLTPSKMRAHLAVIEEAVRASDTGRSEAEAGRPAEGVRPPGETLWLAHGAMFGSASGDWDDLDLINKLRWASVEDSAIRNLMAQSNTLAIAHPAKPETPHPPARGRGDQP